MDSGTDGSALDSYVNTDISHLGNFFTGCSPIGRSLHDSAKARETDTTPSGGPGGEGLSHACWQRRSASLFGVGVKTVYSTSTAQSSNLSAYQLNAE